MLRIRLIAIFHRGVFCTRTCTMGEANDDVAALGSGIEANAQQD